MPEVDKETRSSRGVEDAQASAPEKVKLPPTEAERKAEHFAGLRTEDEAKRGERRVKELSALFEVHKDNVLEAHDNYPTPPVPFVEMGDEDRTRWNEKRKLVDSANRAYHLAIRRACLGHREEDIHLAKARDAAKPSA